MISVSGALEMLLLYIILVTLSKLLNLTTRQSTPDYSPPAPYGHLIAPSLPRDEDALNPGVVPRYIQRDVKTVRDLWRGRLESPARPWKSSRRSTARSRH
jgi:hypothetical protein